MEHVITVLTIYYAIAFVITFKQARLNSPEPEDDVAALLEDATASFFICHVYLLILILRKLK